LQESARQLPLDAQVAHDLAWAAYGLGKLDEARREMQRCLRSQPEAVIAQDAETFLTFTSFDRDEAALVQARPQIEAKLKSDPNYVPALMAAAALDVKDGRKDEALKRMQQVLQRFPDFALAQRDLATLYLQDPARQDEACNLASNARKMLPDDPKIAEVLGECAYEQKDYARAEQLLEESSRKSPLDATGRYYLGLTYKQQKKAAAAIRELTAALSAGLSSERSQQAQQALIELQTAGTE
jgi:predicted Zn-dependent protease